MKNIKLYEDFDKSKIELTFLEVDQDTGNFVYKGSNGKIYMSLDGIIHDTTEDPDYREPIGPVHNVVIKKGEPVYSKEDRFGRNPGSKLQENSSTPNLLSKVIYAGNNKGNITTNLKSTGSGLILHIWKDQWSPGSGEYYEIKKISHQDWKNFGNNSGDKIQESLNEGISADSFSKGLVSQMQKYMPKDRWKNISYENGEISITNDFEETATYRIESFDSNEGSFRQPNIPQRGSADESKKKFND